MVVIIIIGILAAMAVPTFTKSMESAREKEARATLGLICNAQRMYRIDKRQGYAGALGYMTSYIVDPNETAEYYSYAIASANANSFTATATRNNDPSRILTINEDGKITP
jgi:type IV pilus assembly protein PilE